MDITFNDVCAFLDIFTKISRGSEKSSCVRDYLHKCKEKIRLNNKNQDDCIASFYSLIRLILPTCDRDRAPYGMKEFKFSRIIINMLRLPARSTDAALLTNFRVLATISVRDFAEAAFYVLRKHYTTSSDHNITVSEVHKYLDAVADRNANNDPSKCLY